MATHWGGRWANTVRIGWAGRRERRIPYQPIQKILRRQRARIRAIVDHAYRTVPFYREAMDERGLRPADLRSAEDLERLPLIGAEALQRSPKAFRSSRYGPRACFELYSTGTSGTGRRLVLWDVDALRSKLAHGERDRQVLYGLLGKTWGHRRLSLFHSASTTQKVIRFLHDQVVVPRARADTTYLEPDIRHEDLADWINRHRPDVVYSYGSHAEQFFRYVTDRRIPLSPPRVWVYGADALSPDGRRRIEGEFGCRVHSTYQMVEAGRVGFECERGSGFHLNIDLCAVRIVDPQGQTLPPGEAGEIVVSNLSNRATVLLNYRTGDLGSMAKSPCSCGRTLPLLERLEGRTSDLLHLADGREILDHMLIHAVKEELKDVLQLQIVEAGIGRFTLRVVPVRDVDRDALGRALVRQAERALGDGDRISVEFVASIPRGPLGKLRRVVHEPAEPPGGEPSEGAGR